MLLQQQMFVKICVFGIQKHLFGSIHMLLEKKNDVRMYRLWCASALSSLDIRVAGGG
jgi:hypothetical protein